MITRIDDDSKLERDLKYNQNGRLQLKLIPKNNIAISWETEKDWDDLMQTFELNGWFGRGRSIPTDIRPPKQSCCLMMKNSFYVDDKEVYQKYGKQIISHIEFYSSQSPPITLEMIKEFNDLFDKYRPKRKSKG